MVKIVSYLYEGRFIIGGITKLSLGSAEVLTNLEFEMEFSLTINVNAASKNMFMLKSKTQRLRQLSSQVKQNKRGVKQFLNWKKKL